MVLHFGHLVHRPSGISRFFDFEPANFGFLAKVVFVVLGGGVTPGSLCSVPTGFLLKELEAMISKNVQRNRRAPIHQAQIEFVTMIILSLDSIKSNATGHCPDANFSGAGGS